MFRGSLGLNLHKVSDILWETYQLHSALTTKFTQSAFDCYSLVFHCALWWYIIYLQLDYLPLLSPVWVSPHTLSVPSPQPSSPLPSLLHVLSYPMVVSVQTEPVLVFSTEDKPKWLINMCLLSTIGLAVDKFANLCWLLVSQQNVMFLILNVI